MKVGRTFSSSSSMRQHRRIAIGINLEEAYKHHTDVAAGILQYAKEHGWECQFEPFIDAAQRRNKQRFDGVIARVTRSAARFLKRAHIPTVNVWLASPDKSMPRVICDQYAAGQMAATHLLDRGFHRFAFVGFLHDNNSDLQLKGFRETISKRGYTCSSHYLARNPKNAQAWRRLQDNLVQWVNTWKTPVGVFLSQDIICRYLANTCLEAGRRIPDDIALIGCANTELLCESLSPTLTSIEHRSRQLGYEAAHLLEKLMNGAPPPPKPILISPAALIERASTDVYAVNDPILAKALRYIADNSVRPIGVRDVVANLHITRRSLERRFRKLCGYTIHDGITRSRISRFKRLLVDTDAPIKSLATDAGFSSSEYLSKVFRNLEGMTPGSFRKDHQRDPASTRQAPAVLAVDSR